MLNFLKYRAVIHALTRYYAKSDREIASTLKPAPVSPTLVGKLRRWMEMKKMIPKVAVRRGADGKSRKKRRTPAEMAAARDRAEREAAEARRRKNIHLERQEADRAARRRKRKRKPVDE
jgi:hypothetical protein